MKLKSEIREKKSGSCALISYHNSVDYVVVVVFQGPYSLRPRHVGLRHDEFDVLHLHASLVNLNKMDSVSIQVMHSKPLPVLPLTISYLFLFTLLLYCRRLCVLLDVGDGFSLHLELLCSGQLGLLRKIFNLL